MEPTNKRFKAANDLATHAASEMGVPQPNATKDKVLKLMSCKEKLEAKISEYGAILAANDDVGMNGPLVDAEGFPRNDIDVFRVRQARQQIICLQNDHKELMSEIEQFMHLLHASSVVVMDTEEPAEQEQQMEEQVTARVAQLQINDGNENGASPPKVIAKVNLVSPGSPAEQAGICVGDDILEFGSVNGTNFNQNLIEIGTVVRHRQNQRIVLKIQRDGQNLELILIPKIWSGRGLLGCNIVLPPSNPPEANH